MAILSAFANMFGNNTPVAPTMPGQLQTAGAQPAQPTPGNIPAGGGATNPSNPTVPAGPNTTDSAAASPLAQFGDLWKPVNNPATSTEPLFGNVDPKKLMEAAQKTNFAQLITTEQQQAIAAGGEGAVQAFSQAMNLVAQNVFAQSALASTKIVDEALARQQEKFKAMLPSLVKQHTLADNLRNDNPIFKDPAVQPLIAAMEHQLAAKHPNATATELTDLAKQYVAGLGAVFNPALKADSNATTAKSGEEDWSLFLSN